MEAGSTKQRCAAALVHSLSFLDAQLGGIAWDSRLISSDNHLYGMPGMNEVVIQMLGSSYI